MNYLILDILCACPINRERAVRELLTILEDSAPSISPDRVGLSEPVRTPFAHPDADVILRKCSGKLLWRKSKGAVTGNIAMGIPNRHSFVKITANGSEERATDMVTFLCAAAKVLDIHFAFVHRPSLPEMQAVPRATFAALDQGVYTDDLRRGIPSLGWVTMLGQPYINLFDAEKLKQIKAWNVSWPTSTTFLLQLTQSSLDVNRQFAEFNDLRRDAIQQLGIDAFWTDNPKVAASRLPDFTSLRTTFAFPRSES